MSADQLAFDVPLPSHSVTDETASILALLSGNPKYDGDRRRIVEAVVYASRQARGFVNPNLVRSRLSLPDGTLVVAPHVIGRTYQQLVHRGFLKPSGHTESDDRHGGNAGKWVPTYRLVRKSVAA